MKRRRHGGSENSFGLVQNAATRHEPLPIPGRAPPRETESDKLNAFKRVRHWVRNDFYVLTLLGLFQDFCQFGEKLVAVNQADAPKLKDWLAEPGNTAPINAYLHDVWAQELGYDNVVSVWRDRGKRPFTLSLDELDYEDPFGEEKLTWRHGLSAEDIRGVPSMTAHEVKLHESTEFSFRVLKREPMGSGFGLPRLHCLTKALEMIDGVQVGDALLGEECRTLIRQHLLGHEIRSAHHSPTAGYMTAKRKKAVEDGLKGKRGVIEAVSNFDHSIRHFFPDAKLFDARRYATAEQRIFMFFTPLGDMLKTRGGVAPFLLGILRARVTRRRLWLEPYLNDVLNEAFSLPCEVRMRWSNRCFTDARATSELLRFGLINGPLSQDTFRDEAGFDVDEELDRKRVEAKRPPEEKLPAFDAAHGVIPGEPPPAGPNRRRGRTRIEGRPGRPKAE